MWAVFATLIWIPATILIWKKMVTDPGNILLEIGGDGGKNYFTYLYHSLYGKGTWFRGMNYPYGEHIVYTDAQPLLSVSLSYLPGIDFQSALAVMHLFIVLGFVLGLVFIFKILVHFKVHPAVAILASLLILTISPQTEKVVVHFGLSYMCVVPMLFFWSVKYHQQHRLRYPFYIFILGCIVSFLHPYFAAVVLIWAGCYALSYVLVEREHTSFKVKHVSAMLLAAAGVALVVKGALVLTDPIKDRPAYPAGVLNGLTNLVDIFSFKNSPLSQYLHEQGWLPLGAPSEGATYPGVVTLVVIVCSLLGVFITSVRNRQIQHPVLSRAFFSPSWLLMAFFALLFAMGVPFIWDMEWLVDYASAFRQFRTLGRFSWIFFYIATIYAVLIIYHWFARQQHTRKKIATSVLVLAAAVWGFEASGYIRNIHEWVNTGLYRNYLFLSRVERNWKLYLEAEGYKPADFQAVIAVPFTHVGSEKVWLVRDDMEAWQQVLAWRVCVQTGLPMVNVMMSRSSWSQTFEHLRLAGGPYASKSLFRLQDQRPFLLLTMETDSITNPDDRYLVDNAELIGAHGDLKAYKLYPATIRAADSSYKARALQVGDVIRQGDSCIHQGGAWYVNHFDNGGVKNVLFGGGALPAPKQKAQVLAEIALPLSAAGLRYECSAWILANSKDFRTPHLILEYYDSRNQSLGKDVVHVSKATDSYNMWLRASGLYTFPSGCALIRCRIIEGNTCLAVDELMIRPIGATVISKDRNGAVMANNHLVQQR